MTVSSVTTGYLALLTAVARVEPGTNKYLLTDLVAIQKYLLNAYIIEYSGIQAFGVF